MAPRRSELILSKSSLEQCKERRQQRLQTRRSSTKHNVGHGASDIQLLPPSTSLTMAMQPLDLRPFCGSFSFKGRSHGTMEDTISVHKSFCSPSINYRQPVHFFGVFDGHGGTHVT